MEIAYLFWSIVVGIMLAAGMIPMAFAVPTYVNGELVSVDYSTNFFFTQEPYILKSVKERKMQLKTALHKIYVILQESLFLLF